MHAVRTTNLRMLAETWDGRSKHGYVRTLSMMITKEPRHHHHRRRSCFTLHLDTNSARGGRRAAYFSVVVYTDQHGANLRGAGVKVVAVFCPQGFSLNTLCMCVVGATIIYLSYVTYGGTYSLRSRTVSVNDSRLTEYLCLCSALLIVDKYRDHDVQRGERERGRESKTMLPLLVQFLGRTFPIF